MPRRPPVIQNMTVSKRLVKRYAVYSCLGISAIMFVIYMFSDPCYVAWHTQLLCEEYTQGSIAGDMCYDLCVLHKIRVQSCLKDHHGNYVWTINDTSVIKVRDRHLEKDGKLTSLHHVYRAPPEGISMDEFRSMVAKNLDQRLGDGDHSYRVHQLMNTADVNKDDKVSLAEAKTLWSLLKHNEFLVLEALQNSFHIPRVSRYCGEMYQLTNLPPRVHRRLYNLHNGIIRTLFPSTYTWNLPTWVDRGKIAVGFLEFALDIYQHQNDGSFYLCEMNETNVGFSHHHDFQTIDFSDVLPRRTLESYVYDITCSTHEQCRYTEHCTTVCDANTKKCTGELVRPNLSLVCDLLSPYLLPDIPKVLRADFLNMIFKCSKLKTTAADFEVQHSLIINDLKSLLWRHISADV